MTMYPPERQREITDLLLQLDGRRASVAQISARLKVTTETVRRDLDVLERRGVLQYIWSQRIQETQGEEGGQV